jgi:acyl-coenzyme A thioesterase PaaI-like protein
MVNVHDDLCFGCGRANLFGLQLELEPAEEGVAGRFFVKQDHQGWSRAAHGGVIAAALDEAMALAVHVQGIRAVTARLRVGIHVPVSVGTFVRLEARVDERQGTRLETRAVATDDQGRRVATATATFVEGDRDSV